MGRLMMGKRYSIAIEIIIADRKRINTKEVEDELRDRGHKNGPSLNQINHYLRQNGFIKIDRGTYQREDAFLFPR